MEEKFTKEMIVEITKRVLAGLEREQDRAAGGRKGIFADVGEAVEKAWIAQKRLTTLTMQKRDEIIVAMREMSKREAPGIAELAVRETDMGRVQDKIVKMVLAAEKTPGTEDLRTEAFSGDRGITVVELAPFGVIGAITPVTNPTSTVINNSIGMIAAGNAVVFNSHPSAKNCTLKTIEVLNEAIVESGGPPNLLTAIEQPTIETAKAIISHPKVSMLVATGGRNVVNAVLSSGKKAIGAGAGNPPVVVDHTADIAKAARSIIDGASIDNNIQCIAEKEIIAVENIADELLNLMGREGAIILGSEWIEPITRLLFWEDSSGYHVNQKFIGKDIQVILRELNMEISRDARMAVIEVGRDHPLVQLEQLMPVIPLVRVKNVDQAIDLAVEVEHGNRHTAMIHSVDVNNMTKFARSIQTTIFVKNAPSYAGIGFGGEGFTCFTIAGPTGEGLTSAKCFTRVRRCVLVDALSIV